MNSSRLDGLVRFKEQSVMDVDESSNNDPCMT